MYKLYLYKVDMNAKLSQYWIFGLCLFGLFYLSKYKYTHFSSPNSQINKLEKDMNRELELVKSVVFEPGFYSYSPDSSLIPNLQENNADVLAGIKTQLYIENKGHLRYWTAKSISWQDDLGDQITQEGITQINDQWLYFYQQPFPWSESTELLAYYPLPFYFENENIDDKESVLPYKMVRYKTDLSFRSPTGRLLAYLEFDGSFPNKSQQHSLFFIFLLGWLSLFVAIIDQFQKIEKFSSKKYYSLGLLLGGTVLWNMIPGFLGMNNILPDIDLVQKTFNSGMFSLGLLEVISISLCMLTGAIIFHRQVRFPDNSEESLFSRMGHAVVGYVLIILLMMGLVLWIQSLVLNSELAINLGRLFKSSGPSWVLLGSILAVSFAIFILSHRISTLRSSNPLKLGQRLSSMLLALVMCIPVMLICGLATQLVPFGLITIAILLLFDWFTDGSKIGVIWMIVWTIAISGSLASLLYGFGLEKSLQNKNEFIEEINAKEWENKDVFSAYSMLDSVKSSRYAYTSLDYQLLQREGIVSADSTENGPWPSPSEYRLNQELAIKVISERFVFSNALSLFSFLFSCSLLFLTLFTICNSYFRFFPGELGLNWSYRPSLRNRIQLAVIASILLSFVVIAWVTVIYTQTTEQENSWDKQRSQAASISRDLQLLESNKNWNRTLQSQCPILEEIHDVPILIFDAKGNRINGICPIADRLHPAIQRIPYKAHFDISYLGNRESQITGKNESDGIYTKVVHPNLGDHIYLTVKQKEIPQWEQAAGYGLLGNLLNVYVFLFLLAGSVALGVADSITWPISQLGQKLKSFKLGQKNEVLNWEGTDELAVLIQNYNAMVQELEQSAEFLAKSERDIAWREMAQQVAHEIKNPLTPMKLSIQYLQRAAQSDPEQLKSLLKRASETLLEQIQNLSQIATAFSNFGAMPKAENEKVVLNEIVASVHDLFRKRDDMDINLFVPIDELVVFADKNHLIRILNNLVKNAIQAIPEDRTGEITMRLTKEANTAVIEVKDNGVGIPPTMHDKVFKPNFTTKSSGTGLGLAISSNLIESFNGRIYFVTTQGEGTSFFVELPLMRSDYAPNLPRVSLDD